jgi:hypothetical protein
MKPEEFVRLFFMLAKVLFLNSLLYNSVKRWITEMDTNESMKSGAVAKKI